MIDNKRTVERYMEAFGVGDHAEVLACLADDVEWEVPGTFQLSGKEAFDREMANPAFTGTPHITVTRVISDGDIVIAEGSVRTQTAKGEELELRFCDVFELRDGRIRKLTSYLMPVH